MVDRSLGDLPVFFRTLVLFEDFEKFSRTKTQAGMLRMLAFKPCWSFASLVHVVGGENDNRRPAVRTTFIEQIRLGHGFLQIQFGVA